MHCSGCGRSLTDGLSICLHCGTPISNEFAAKGVAVMAETRPEPLPTSGNAWPELGAPTSPYGSNFSDYPPPPPPTPRAALPENAYPDVVHPRRRALSRTLLAMCIAALLFLSTFGIYRLVSAKTINVYSTTSRSDGALGSLPTPLDQDRCTVTTAQLDAAKANIIKDVQLASGVKDLQRGDYTPIDVATSFQVGGAAYLTFTVADLTESGTLLADWCLGPSNILAYKQIAITPGQVGVKGYFSVSNIDKAAVGASRVVLWWRPAEVTGSQRESAILLLTFSIVDASAPSH